MNSPRRTLLLCLPIAALSACGGDSGHGRDAAFSIRIEGAERQDVRTDTPIALVATVKDARGNTLDDRRVTWTSSQPDMVRVDASGRLTAHRLTDPSAPVTITATADGRQDEVGITSYGLDARGGVAVVKDGDSTTAMGTARVWFRNADQTTVTTGTPFELSGPAGATPHDQPVLGTLFSDGTGTWFGTTPVTGTYRVSLDVNGVRYTKTFTLDASSKLQPVSAAHLDVVGPNLTISGSPAAGTVSVSAAVTQGGTTAATSGVVRSSALPVTVTLQNPVTPGHYDGQIVAYGYDASDVLHPYRLPAQLNRAVVLLERVEAK